MVLVNKNDYLRKIPSVDEILNRTEVQELTRKFPRSMVVKAVQQLLEERRKKILSATDFGEFEQGMPPEAALFEIEEKICKIKQLSLRRVINASGIIVHTNLGRAPLSQEAIKAVGEMAKYYSNLEFDLENGQRGFRFSHVEGLLKELTEAGAGFVVNNNAAAVLLCLNTMAKGKEVIISRGELIEIGGSFRIPEIMEQSGARLVEVGTTNRTHIRDYREAVNEQTAVILKAHTSNYRVVGFSSEVELSELNRLGREHNVPVMFDMGSGNFLNSSVLGLKGEPTVQDAVRSGIDIITFSGDKLLGGPQAGIIIGKDRYLKTIKNNPLARALRIDKLTLAALEATLRTYVLTPEHIDDIPVMRMLRVSDSLLKKRAQKIVRAIKKQLPFLDVSVIQDASQVGGGAYPLHDLPTWMVSINPLPLGVNEFESCLRTGTPAVITRISRDRVLLDMRTIFPEEASLIPKCIFQVIHKNKQKR
jgi:L-seryl-tRNA(Ser) seleniumtransferase